MIINLPRHTALITIGLILLVVPVVGQASGNNDWQYSFSPYVWGTALKGDVATIPPAKPAKVDVSFNDILENLDLAVMGIGQARKGKWGVWGDVFYSKISADADTRDVLYSGADYDQTLFFLTAGGSYRLLDRDSFSVDALGGIRYTYLDNKFKLGAGLLPEASRNANDSWYDPILGVTMHAKAGIHWYVSGWAMAAVAGDSDSTYDIFGGLGYAFSDSRSMIIGYRRIDIDYENGDFLYDVTLSGPMAGFTFRW